MLHKHLLKLRKEHKLTQQELSSRLGIARTTYSGYELGTSEPDNETLSKLANFYDVSIDYLLGRTNDPNRVLQAHSRKMIDLFEQNKSADEIFQAFNGQFLVGGIPMDKNEALFIIDYLRTKWAMEMKPDHASKQ